jgi:hypothetical protein
LDDRLIPHAQNVDLTKTLQAVRSKVAGHLKMAKDIQSTPDSGQVSERLIARRAQGLKGH